MKEKAVLVTGASRGIGSEIALALGRKGYCAGVNYTNNEKKAMDIVKKINEADGNAVAIKADIGCEDDVNNMITRMVDEFGEIYGLVNNAGIYHRKKFSELTLKDWEETMRVNLTGTFLCCKASLPHFCEQNGRIVNIASVLAHMGSGQGAHYAASKAGIIGFSKSLARELSPRGITVNVVAPGATETDIIAGDTPEKRAERGKITPVGRVAQPREIAEAVLFLLSKKAGYITGETLNVNGGMWMV